MLDFLSKIFGNTNARYISSLEPIVQEINAKEAEYEKMSDEELRGVTARFKERLRVGDPSMGSTGSPQAGSGQETLDDILPDAFAAVREAARRTLNQRHFDVQLIGGIVLHQGKIAEMRTGEGKTLVATLPLYLNALMGEGAHLVTPNDYLSRVGAGWMGGVYFALGVSVAVISHESSGMYDPEFQDPKKHADERLNHFRPVTRTEAYAADITYGTNNEFGFDYLRDNLEYSVGDMRQRPHAYAIVDEIDSILIDEARTPLIISVPDEEPQDTYRMFARIVPQLKENADYNIDEKMKAVSLTEEGIEKVEKIVGVENIYEEKGFRFVRYLESALRAQTLFQKDRDYVVKNGEVVIVDEFTGRLMPGRRWSEGLHQAIEAKEGVQVQKESRTLATVTFQNYFRLYKKLAGMTGTAETSAEEFYKVYNLEVIIIPTHRPSVREDKRDYIFRTENGKFMAVVSEVKERSKKGQPVLIGTVSIEKSERVSKMLQIEGVKHEVLNAKNHENEALIIAQAGRKGAVTVATNMAGRGVDILLGGSPQDMAEAEEVRGFGGLFVLGTERHEARRIDNQLRGRAGRQGDNGASQFFVSLEDDLMRIFGSEKVKNMLETLGVPEDQPIEHGMVSRALEGAQAKIEGFHFDSRKYVLDFDDVLNKQRDYIYGTRRKILTSEDAELVRDTIIQMFDEEIDRIVLFHTASDVVSEWNLEEIFENIKTITSVGDEARERIRESAGDREAIKVYLKDILQQKYAEHVATLGEKEMAHASKTSLLRTMDMLWMEHLDQMAHLRDSVRLRAYGQRDPLVEYKREGSTMFKDLRAMIRTQVVNTVLKVVDTHKHESHVGHNHTFTAPVVSLKTPQKDVDRNDPCPCGSGKKYKRCHGA